MKNFFHSLFEILETVAIAAIIVVAFRGFIGQPFLVDGTSMEPTFKDSDYLIIDQITYKIRDPKRGEPVVFLYPKDPRQDTYYIKRIIGLPGERIKITDGSVTISKGTSSLVLSEPYIRKELGGTSIGADVTLNNNEYFVMGDNRGASFDSRSWGALDEKYLVGLVRMRLWPLQKISVVHPPAYDAAD